MKLRAVSISAFGCLLAVVARAADHYEFYQPQVTHVTIHEGKLADGHYAYNHMASVEWFDGQFHAVWGGNAATHKEAMPGQVNLWATSRDFRQWSPASELTHQGAFPLKRDPDGMQWQPNLLNYHGRQLWCVWSFNSRKGDLEGVYLSTLDAGSRDWRHRRIMRRMDVGGMSCRVFASQNPVLLPSGRVLAPVTLMGQKTQRDMGEEEVTVLPRFNACLYTDDDGATWQCSDQISNIENTEGQWEPFFYQQGDGRIRAFMRNSLKGAADDIVAPANQWRVTTVGTGADKGTPVCFPDDPIYSFMETAYCRPQVFRLPGGRYCLLQQDAVVDHWHYHGRLNVALHFSRSGADDFVAGPPVSRPEVVSAYPQGVQYDGNIYLAYTVGPGNFPRSIEGAIVEPGPRADRYYVWPRAKELVEMRETVRPSGNKKMVRSNPGQRTALPVLKAVGSRQVVRFAERASAGVDIDPVDFAAGQSLALSFDAKVLRLQPLGMLVLCSFGDRIPLRLGMPSNRPGKLYAYTRDQWQPVADFPLEQWHTLQVTVEGDCFTVVVDEQPPQTFANPLVNPRPRLYLGDGFEVDYYPSNDGSAFQVDLGRLATQVVPAAEAVVPQESGAQ